MTRSTKSLFSIVTVIGAMAATAVPAMADGYSSVSSITGDESSSSGGYSSPTAILADGGESQAPSTPSAGSPNAILGADGLGSPAGQPVSAPSSNGFDWGDAGIGSAVGLGLAAMLGAAYTVTRRRRPGVQPSV